MKKMKSAIAAFLLLALVLSLTACGSSKNDQPTTGVNQTSTGAAGGTAEASSSAPDGTAASTAPSEGTAAYDDGTGETSAAVETKEGVIDGLMNDVEKGADAVKRGVDDITDPTQR